MKVENQDIILIGGGGHCSSVIDVIELEGRFRIAGIVDIEARKGQANLGYPFLGTDSDIPSLIREYRYFFITIGQIRDPGKRIRIFNILKNFSIELLRI